MRDAKRTSEPTGTERSQIHNLLRYENIRIANCEALTSPEAPRFDRIRPVRAFRQTSGPRNSKRFIHQK